MYKENNIGRRMVCMKSEFLKSTMSFPSAVTLFSDFFLFQFRLYDHHHYYLHLHLQQSSNLSKKIVDLLTRIVDLLTRIVDLLTTIVGLPTKIWNSPTTNVNLGTRWRTSSVGWRIWRRRCLFPSHHQYLHLILNLASDWSYILCIL